MPIDKPSLHEEVRGVFKFSTHTPTVPRRNRLLMIGIGQYERLPVLEHPVEDCKRLLSVLQDHYGISEKDIIGQLFDQSATRQEMYEELFRLRGDDGTPVLTEEDNLILVFAGHGYYNNQTDLGYWMPVDAPLPSSGHDPDKTMISVKLLVDILSGVQAHHVLLVVDACFAGAFARISVALPGDGDWNNPEEKPSRWALTSGRNQVVADKSPFSKALLETLYSNTELDVSIKWIGSEIERRVGREGFQRPFCGAIVPKELEGGEFFFHRQTAAPKLKVLPWQIMTPEELPHRLRHGSQAHLAYLKKHRFKYLRIESTLLTGVELPESFETRVLNHEKETPIHQALRAIWPTECRHAIVLGQGGMGKTVALTRLWEDLLAEPSLTAPVFIALNDYNSATTAQKSDFILHYIAQHCLGLEDPGEDWKNTLWKYMQAPLPDGSPVVVLLLDGFNEITVEKNELLLQLNKISEQAAGVQMVLTSRYVETRNFSWAQHAEILPLQPLLHSQIEYFLRKVSLPAPASKSLFSLFENPMMLSLYAGSCSIREQYTNDSRFHFLPVNTQGELLWNFHEAQIARFMHDSGEDVAEQYWLEFLLRHLLPYLAFRMEQAGQFFIHTKRSDAPEFNIKSVLEDAFREWNHEDFTDTFPVFEGHRRLLGFGVLPDEIIGVQERYVKIRKYLVDKLNLLVAEDSTLRFLHQHFRDFFACCHLRNEAKISIRRRELPACWKERPFPIYLRKMLGEIEGEYALEPLWDDQNQTFEQVKSGNLLAQLYHQCKGSFEKDTIGFMVWNLVNISMNTRTSLAGMDLSDLNLEGIKFNGVPLNVNHGSAYCGVNFSHSLLNARQFLSASHTDALFDVQYSPDNQRAVSLSRDGSIMEWNLETGSLLRVVSFELGDRIAIAESLSGRLRFSNDGTLIYAAVGRLLSFLEVDSFVIRTATRLVYDTRAIVQDIHPDGTKIITSDYNGSILENTNEDKYSILLNEYRPNYGGSSAYNQAGDKVLIASDSLSVREHNLSMPERSKVFSLYGGWSAGVQEINIGDLMYRIYYYDNIYGISIDNPGQQYDSIFLGTELANADNRRFSPDGRYLLASFEQGSQIKVFETNSWQEVFLLTDVNDHTHWFFTPDGKYFVAKRDSSGGPTLIYSLETGELKDTFNMDRPYAIYGPGEKTVLSTAFDHKIYEWSVETETVLRVFDWSAEKIEKFVYSQDGSTILAASPDGAIFEKSAQTGETVRQFKGHNQGILNMRYSDDGKNILSFTSDEIKTWSVISGDCLTTITIAPNLISAYQYAPDNRKLHISGGIWSLRHPLCVKSIDGFDGTFSPDGRILFTAEYNGKMMVNIWDLFTGGKVFSMEVANYEPAFNHRKDRFLLQVADDIAKEFSLDTFEVLQIIPLVEVESRRRDEIQYSEDDRFLYFMNGTNISIWSTAAKSFVKTLDIEHPQQEFKKIYPLLHGFAILTRDDDSKTLRISYWVHNAKGIAEQRNAVLPSGYDRFFYVRHQRKNKLLFLGPGIIKIWNPELGDGFETIKIPIHLTALKVNADGSKLALMEEYPVIWSVDSGQHYKVEWDGDPGCFEFSPLGTSFFNGEEEFDATSGIPFRKVNFEVETRRKTSRWDRELKFSHYEIYERLLFTDEYIYYREQRYDSEYIRTLEYSDDDRFVIATYSDGVIRLWSTETASLSFELKGHTYTINRVLYVAAEQLLISASEDRTVKCWSLQTGDCLRTIRQASERFEDIRYDPSQSCIWSVNAGGTIKKWHWPTFECIKTHPSDQGYRHYLYSPDGSRILKVVKNGYLEERDLATDTLLWQYSCEHFIAGAFYSTCGTQVMLSLPEKGMDILSSDTGQVIQSFSTEDGQLVKQAIFSAEHDHMLLWFDDKTVVELSARSFEIKQSFQAEYFHCWKRLGFIARFDDFLKETILQFWWADEGTWDRFSFDEGTWHQFSFNVPGNTYTEPVFSLDKCFVLFASDGKIYLFDCVSDGLLQTVLIPGGVFRLLAYCVEEQKVLLAFENGALEEWSLETGQRIYLFYPRLNMAEKAFYLDSGRTILIQFNDNFIEEYQKGRVKEFTTYAESTKWEEYHIDAELENGEQFSVRNEIFKDHLTINGYLIYLYKKSFAGSSQTFSATYNPFTNSALIQKFQLQEMPLAANGGIREYERVDSVTDENMDYGSRPKLSPDGHRLLKPTNRNKAVEWSVETGLIIHEYINEPDIHVQSCDFRGLHLESQFSEEETARLRRYGAIFNDTDAERWKEAVESVYQK